MKEKIKNLSKHWATQSADLDTVCKSIATSSLHEEKQYEVLLFRPVRHDYETLLILQYQRHTIDVMMEGENTIFLQVRVSQSKKRAMRLRRN